MFPHQDGSPRSALAAQRRSRALWSTADALFWVGSILAATSLRQLYVSEEMNWGGVIGAAVLAGVLHLGMSVLVRPYRAGQPRGSYEEIRALAQCALTTVPVLFVLTFGFAGLPSLLPGTVPVVAALIAFTGMLAFRLVWRERSHRERVRDDATPVVVYGAGTAGRLLVHHLLHDELAAYVPVAIIDDEPELKGLRIEGVRVVGGRESLGETAKGLGVETVVLAAPSAGSDRIRAMHASVEEAGLKTLVLPPLSQLVGSPRGSDLRDIRLEDLLGRGPVTLDEAAIADALTGKTVLVTGAGGSIGSELCRQISRFGVERLVCLDRDESGLHTLQLSLDGQGLLQSDDLVLADIRDAVTLREVFAHHRPDMVFHAAALKHLPLLERYPLEAWQTNVLGTINVLTEAARVGVETFVNVSTDKAADPTCVLGYSKRLAERVTADVDRRDDGRYMSVRFGNVLGSRGSVIPAFRTQIERGGPVTVTHPEVERYFMLIPEACQLVLQAAVLGRGGEVMVLDMGAPVKIVDLARSLIDMSGRHDIDITFTGLRPGEKMSEDLFAAGHDVRETSHDLVTCVVAGPVDTCRVAGLRLKPGNVADSLREWALDDEDMLYDTVAGNAVEAARRQGAAAAVIGSTFQSPDLASAPLLGHS